jgi:predicted enzyme related to lactoylglutathione lyase
MVVRDTPWPDGYPCWVDLMTSDVDAAKEFYSALFGWEVTESGPEAGGYLMAEIHGKPAAGIGPQQPGQEGNPSVWTTYLATSDVDATTDTVAANGGIVLAPPFDVLDVGRMSVVQDPSGATFGLWQPGTHFGAAVANEPGSFTWSEVMTRDYDRAKAFYAAVFGYTFTELGDDGFQYCTIDVAGRPVGGIGTLPADAPKEVPSHWRVYFAVANADEALTKAASLGGAILRPAEDMPYGRWGDASDGQGAMFSLIKNAEPPVE